MLSRTAWYFDPSRQPYTNDVNTFSSRFHHDARLRRRLLVPVVKPTSPCPDGINRQQYKVDEVLRKREKKEKEKGDAYKIPGIWVWQIFHGTKHGQQACRRPSIGFTS